MMAGTTAREAGGYLAELTRAAAAMDQAAVDAYGDLLFETWRQGGTVFILGNGGSASNASHHVADAVKTAMVKGRPRLKALSLADNVELMTAISNDISYDDVFRFQLESYAEPGDVAVAISCSGNSPNVLHAVEWARGRGLRTVGLTGCSGGRLGGMVDIRIHVPSDNYGVIEDLHLSVGHMAAQRLQARVAGESANA
jgi:phosphoheptose isomerase